jgi:hypothetical protein
VAIGKSLLGARFVLVAAVALVATAASLVFVSAASSAAPCTGLITGGTINGDLIVTGACVLDGVTVTGNVTVVPGASLVTKNGTNINVNLSSDGATLIQINDTTFGRDVTITNTANNPAEAPKNVLCNSTIARNLTITGSSSDTKFYVGDLPADDPCNGADTIHGNVVLSNNKASMQLSDSHVYRNVIFTNNGLGTAEEVEHDLGQNQIDGNLVCLGNATTPPEILFNSDSTVNGHRVGQCNNPAPGGGQIQQQEAADA